ncbi:hypothetical protein [Neorhodopirellula lusitana]|uniref:hypothetical protein n=1 Tax=Neorhodopirellula lusitana TaxID=445327 RepID=UPI0038505B58
MNISRDRLKLRDFTPLRSELEVAQQLNDLKSRFDIDEAGHIVTVHVRDRLTDEHVHLVRALKKLTAYSSTNNPIAAAGISDSGMADLLLHPGLADVICHGNLRLTGQFFDSVRRSPSIKRIGVPYSPITDASLALARNCSLSHLSVRGSKISDASVDNLCSMRSLSQIHVKQTCISPFGLKRLRDALPDCWIDMLDRPNDG